jgi:hypothetical protein
MHLLAETLIGKDCQIIISSSGRFQHPFKFLLVLLPESLRGEVAEVTGEAYAGKLPQHNGSCLMYLNAQAKAAAGP